MTTSLVIFQLADKQLQGTYIKTTAQVVVQLKQYINEYKVHPKEIFQQQQEINNLEVHT